jgi:TonB family protein
MSFRPPLFECVLGTFISLLLPSQIPPQLSSTGNVTSPYPNDTEGLRRLLNDMLVAPKSEGLSKLKALIQQTEIPNYQSWFTINFGEEKGESWAKPYGRWLEKNEKEFQELLVKLAHMDGELTVENLDAAKRYDLMNGPLHEHRASWKRPEAPMGEGLVSVADFFFIEGKFRWYTSTWYDQFQKTQNSSLVVGKLVKKVEPEYPAEAREKKIQGTVKLQVIVRKDGTVTVQNVWKGDPALSAAAIEAVRQWRYDPWQINGQPIELPTTINVVFSLIQ